MEEIREVSAAERRLEERVFAPLERSGRGFYFLVIVLLVIVAWGLYGYFTQIRDGLWVTGLRDRVFWGLYIALFIFFVSASAGVTVLSAALKLFHAPWRAPITRVAEMMTVALLATAFIFILLDIGRPDRVHHMLLFGRWESPLMWDVFALTTTLVGRLIYLNMAMIRDLALCRDYFGSRAPWPRRLFYRTFAVGWSGNATQERLLNIGLPMMTVFILPVAIMTPTVASWIFSMTLRAPWDNPMFAIYFASGAVYSGVALVVIMLVIIRKVYGLEEFVTRRHFRNLGYILAFFAALMLFFSVSDFITMGYKMEGSATVYLYEQVAGGLAPIYWAYIWAGLVTPLLLIGLPFTRRIGGIVLAAVLAAGGVAIDWYYLVVAGLTVPQNPYETPSYAPTATEWGVSAGVIALFVLIIVVLLKLLPSVTVTDMEHPEESGLEPLGVRGSTAPGPASALEGVPT